MLYKGYRIKVTEPEPKQYMMYVFAGKKMIHDEGYFNYENNAIQSAKRVIDEIEIDKNPYTPDIRPPYMWIPVENDLPPDLTRVLAVWECKHSKMVSRSHIGFESKWKSLEHPGLNDNEHWRVTYWQYTPALPE